MLRLVGWLIGCGIVILVASASCRDRTPPAPPEISAQTAHRVGLTDAERAEFYHLEEGSEVFPLDFFLALEDESGQGLFAQNLERFGFLPDAASRANPHSLPVGVTAATTRDLQFSGIQMIGVNCAACHVSELQHKGTRVRLDGAGGRADITAFYQGLAKAAQATVTDPQRFLRFVQRLRNRSANPAISDTAAMRSSRVFRGLPDVAALAKETSFDRELHRELIDVIAEEAKRPAIDLTETFALKPGPAQAAAQAAVTAKLRAGLSPQALAARVPPQPSAKSAIARTTDAGVVRSSVQDLFSDVITTVRLFKARLEFLLRIAQRMDVQATVPGFGRIDAFGGARNLLFEGNQASTAPVSYPHLWNFERLDWVHWDANTTSVLERNIGQALGLGAVIVPATHQSTVSVVNLHRLEQLSLKIRPPRWEDTFDPIDKDSAARGQSLFERHCASCHASDPNHDDRVLELSRIGTDPNRSVSFAAPVGTTSNDRAIADFMGKVKRRAFQEKGFTSEQQKQLEGGRPAMWRLTKGYVARPLIAVWATPPYLHNNSVPTLHDLLLPPEKRPATFFVGATEYDPVNLGFVTDQRPGSWKFDTSQPGNSNRGHVWGTMELSERDRRNLLEFLKR